MDKKNNTKIIRHLNWLRLRYKNVYSDYISYNLLSQIIVSLTKKSNENMIIEKICNKLYYGFDINKDEKSMFDIGYTQTEKDSIKKHILDIINEYNYLTK